MNAQVPRKGATRAADIPVDVLDALSRGDLQSATLAEGLALDQARLLHTVFPDLSPQTLHAAGHDLAVVGVDADEDGLFAFFCLCTHSCLPPFRKRTNAVLGLCM